MALELRLHDRARATKDIDLVLRDADRDGESVRDLLIDGLALDPDLDGFGFAVGPASSLAADEAGRPGWRFTVVASLAGREFDSLKLDVVARVNEITSTEWLALPGILAFAGVPTREVEVVDQRQHFAEKLHALTKSYGNRSNTRTKDLVDLVILMDDGLEPSVELRATVEHVFRERNTHPVPEQVDDPPAAWIEPYASAASDLGLSATNVDDAMTALRDFWSQTIVRSS